MWAPSPLRDEDGGGFVEVAGVAGDGGDHFVGCTDLGAVGLDDHIHALDDADAFDEGLEAGAVGGVFDGSGVGGRGWRGEAVGGKGVVGDGGGVGRGSSGGADGEGFEGDGAWVDDADRDGARDAGVVPTFRQAFRAIHRDVHGVLGDGPLEGDELVGGNVAVADSVSACAGGRVTPREFARLPVEDQLAFGVMEAEAGGIGFDDGGDGKRGRKRDGSDSDGFAGFTFELEPLGGFVDLQIVIRDEKGEIVFGVG